MGKTISRIALVGTMVAACLPWISSASYAIQVPKTLHAVLGLTGSSPDIAGVEKILPFEATHLGIVWKGRSSEPEIRTAAEEGRWSRWSKAAEFEDMYDGETSTRYSRLMDGHGARRIQIRLREKFGEGDPEGNRQPARLVSVAVINTEDGPLRRIPLVRAAYGAAGQPPVISRAAWGADETIRKGSPAFSRVKKIFVHHAVTPNNDSNPAATLRAVYAYHVQTRGWEDIGYNFLIDRAGRVYEGRYARAYPPGEVPSGEDPNGMGVVGAHTSGHNTGSAGVALLGNTDQAAPSPPAVSSLVNLLAWAADRHGIDPLGSGSSPGAGFANISGHRDSPDASTSCPGRGLYERLGALRRQIESTISSVSGLSAPSMPTGTQMVPPGSSPDPTPAASGDVSRSAVRVDVTFTGKSALSSRTISVSPAGGSFSLTDSSYAGSGLVSDTYTVTAVAFDAQGRASRPAPVSAGYRVSGGPPPLLKGLPLLGDLVAPAQAPTPAAPSLPGPPPVPGDVLGQAAGLSGRLGLPGG